MKLSLTLLFFGIAVADVLADSDAQKDQHLRGLVTDVQCYNCCNSDGDCSQYDTGSFPVYCSSNKNCVRDLSGPPRLTCFSEDSTIQVLGVGPTAMKDLSVGDKVFTGQGYERVYGFGHLDKDMSATFLEIEASNQNNEISTLKITAAHLIGRDGGYVTAQSVKPGDVLEDNQTVTKIHQVQGVGVYAPLTASGKLFVDGFHCSSYVSLQSGAPMQLQVDGKDTGISQHWFSHVAASPLRALCFGVSSAFCENRMLDEHGFAWYTKIGYTVAKFLQNDQGLVQWLCLFAVGVVALIFYTLEFCVGAQNVPVTMVAVGLALVYGTKKWAGVGKPKVA